MEGDELWVPCVFGVVGSVGELVWATAAATKNTSAVQLHINNVFICHLPEFLVARSFDPKDGEVANVDMLICRNSITARKSWRY
jgi:hypothetical protein